MEFLVAGPIDVESLEESARRTEPGAVISFQGVVRPDRTPRGELTALEFAAYEPMAEEEMDRVMAEIRTRWPEAHALCRHRLGRVPVGETSLFLVLSAPDTTQAFQACHFALEQMRARVPIWKKDLFADGSACWSASHRETLLISDSVLSYPPS